MSADPAVILSEPRSGSSPAVILSEPRSGSSPAVILSEPRSGESKDLPVAGFERVARSSDIPPNGLMSVRLSNGARICLIKLGSEVRGIADNCTHRDFALSEGDLHDDGTVECAWHGAQFDSATGEATQGPAYKPVVRYAVRVTDGDIWVGDKLP